MPIFFSILKNSFLKRKIIFFTILLALISACKTDKEEKTQLSLGESITKYSNHLKIYEKTEGTYIHLIHPDQKNKRFLYFIPKSKKASPKEYIVLNTPIKSMVVYSSTHIGMLGELNQIKCIRGIKNRKYIHNKQVLNKVKTNEIIEFGEESQVSFEKIINSKAQMIIYSGFSDDFPKSNKLKKLGINCVPNFDWKESHPLGKAEWILLFGYLTGTEKQAKEYFKNLTKQYQHLTTLASKSKENEHVFSGNIIGDYWYAPGGKSFIAKIFKDASCSYKYSTTNEKGSITMSFEKIFSDNKKSKFWFNSGYKNKTLIRQINPKSIHFDSYKTNNIYCYSHNSNKFWEISACHPEYVLSDIIQITHPEINLDKDLYFYKKVNE